MSGASIIEVQQWHAPPFYLMLEWSKFSELLTEESQWETLLALLIAGSCGLLRNELVIHLKASNNPWGYGKQRFLYIKRTRNTNTFCTGRMYRLSSATTLEKTEILAVLSNTMTVEILSVQGVSSFNSCTHKSNTWQTQR